MRGHDVHLKVQDIICSHTHNAVELLVMKIGMVTRMLHMQGCPKQPV